MQRCFPPTVLDLAFEYLLISNMNYSTTQTTEHSRYFCSLFKCISNNASKTAAHRWCSEEQTDIYVNYVNSTTKAFFPLRSYIAVVYLSTSVGDVVSVSTHRLITSPQLSERLNPWIVSSGCSEEKVETDQLWLLCGTPLSWGWRVGGEGVRVGGPVSLWPMHHHKPSP